MHLDNYRLDDAIMPEREDGMKQLKERVQIGIDSNGKSLYKWATGYTRQEVLLDAARILSEYGQIEALTPQKEGPLFNDYMHEWFENIRSKQVTGRVDEEQGLLKNYIYPFFMGKRLNEIKPGDIDAYFVQSDIQALSTSTAKKHGQFLNMLFRFAMKNGDIGKNPATEYKQLLPRRAAKREALSREDVADIAAHLHALTDEDKLFLSLLLFTGMRRGEALGLQVKHIDPLHSIVHIKQAVRFCHNAPVVKPPKTETSVRTIPIMNGFPFELISSMEPDDYVLGGPTPWTETKERRALQRIGKTIDLHGATPHVLRHTYATLAMSKGVDMKTVQGLLGHATASTTMNIYAHLCKDKILDAAAPLNGMYSTAM